MEDETYTFVSENATVEISIDEVYSDGDKSISVYVEKSLMKYYSRIDASAVDDVFADLIAYGVKFADLRTLWINFHILASVYMDCDVETIDVIEKGKSLTDAELAEWAEMFVPSALPAEVEDADRAATCTVYVVSSVPMAKENGSWSVDGMCAPAPMCCCINEEDARDFFASHLDEPRDEWYKEVKSRSNYAFMERYGEAIILEKVVYAGEEPVLTETLDIAAFTYDDYIDDSDAIDC